ncbi:MAG: PAS domain-containing protein [Nitrospira sp.]|nr:PAS domain-containing protein [Nitrospira sp.]
MFTHDETTRLAALQEYHILDTPPEEAFDDLVFLASQICGTPIAIISLIDASRQWFKAKIGIEASEMPRDMTFCAHVLHHDDLFVVPDASQDPRFADSPLVTEHPGVRFYAGMPLVTPAGQVIGSLCVIDHTVRRLTDVQITALRKLGRQIIRLLESRQSEMRYRHFFEQSHDAMMTLVPPFWHITASNFATVRMFRITDERDLAQAGLWELSPERQPDGQRSVDKAQMMIEQALQNGFHRFEWTHRRITGEEFPTIVTLSRLRIGDIIRLQATIRDIFVEKEAERSLVESEARLNEAQAIARLGNWEFDVVTNYLIWSDETFRIFEIDPMQFQASYEGFLRRVHPEDRNLLEDTHARSIDARTPYEVVYRLLLPDGRIKYVHERGMTHFDDTGYPQRSVGTVQDITAQKISEKTMHQQAERLELATRAAGIGIWDWQLSSDTLIWDDRMYGLYGANREDFAGPKDLWQSRIHPDDREGCEHAHQHAISSLQPYDNEFRIQLPDGSIHFLKGDGRVITDPNGKPVRMLGITYDITARKETEHALLRQTEELHRSNSDLEQFAYISSHDLQEPLRMVSSYCTLLKRRYGAKLPPEASEFLDFAVDGATRMQQLIVELLEYSRVGRSTAPMVRIDCNTLLRKVVKGLEIAITERHATVTIDPLPIIDGDAIQLSRLFQNLIANALKFGGAQPPTVRVTAEPEILPDGRPAWRFAVRDTGIGFDMEFHDRIFVIFQRLHVREDYAGSGMGLAICKRIVDRHNGKIWATSSPGQGSTFFFTLPTQQPAVPTSPARTSLDTTPSTT